MYKNIDMPFIDFCRHNNLKRFCTHFIVTFEKFDTSYKKLAL